jgi:rhamnogalacturonan hydrolase
LKLATHMLSNILSLSFFVGALFATARTQLTGPVGPLNTRASKSNICNVLDYGGSVGSDDIGPAILSAYTVRDASIIMLAYSNNICVELCYQNCRFHPLCTCRYASSITESPRSLIHQCSGNYNMQTWVTLANGTNWAFRLDGFITRTC